MQRPMLTQQTNTSRRFYPNGVTHKSYLERVSAHSKEMATKAPTHTCFGEAFILLLQYLFFSCTSFFITSVPEYKLSNLAVPQ